MSSINCKGIVLVTGAGRRLGREIALELAESGYQIAIHYRDSKQEAIETSRECSKLSGKSAIFDADLTNEKEVRLLLDRAIDKFGKVDAVINSASIFEYDSIHDFTYASMERHLRCNAGAAIILANALYCHLKSREARGSIINILDQKLWNQNPDFLSYTLSKAALNTANTLLALALAPIVRTVGIAPGFTLNSKYVTKEKFNQLHKLAPLGRSSNPKEIAGTVKFALENAAITGTTIIVDGGQHLMRFERDFSMM